MANYENHPDEANTLDTARESVMLPYTGYMHNLGSGDTDYLRLALGPGTYTISVLPDLVQIVHALADRGDGATRERSSR